VAEVLHRPAVDPEEDESASDYPPSAIRHPLLS
jgi:hypothetical protein